MNTASVQILNIVPGESGGKPGLSDAGDSGSQFNEVLSREMEERQATASSDVPGAAAKEAEKVQGEHKSAVEKDQAADENVASGDQVSTEIAAENPETKQLLAFVAQLDGAPHATATKNASEAAVTVAVLPAAPSGRQDMLTRQPAIAQAEGTEALVTDVETPVTNAEALKITPDEAGVAKEALARIGAEEAKAGQAALPSTTGTVADEQIDNAIRQAQAANAVTANKGPGQADKTGLPVAPGLDVAALPEGSSSTENVAVLNPFQQSPSGNDPLVNQGAQMTARLAPEVASPAWNQSLGQQVVWMVNGDVQTASLNLNPPELGPLQITLNVSNNQASANFVAVQPEVRQALEDAMPRLREMLGEAGIELGNANVSTGTPQQQGFESELGSGSGASWTNGLVEEDVPVVENTPVMAVRRQGLVDTFV